MSKEVYNANGEKFFIFADDILWQRFKKHGSEFQQFCGLVGQSGYSTVFLPRLEEEFYDHAGTAIIELSYPTILRYADIDGKQISSNFLEEAINLRKAKVGQAVVIATSEKSFSSFDINDKKFGFVVVDDQQEPGTHVGEKVSYQVVHNLMSTLSIMKNKP